MGANRYPTNPIDCHMLALELMQKGELDQAVAYYRIALSLDPTFYKAYVNLAMVFKLKGDFAAAKKYFKKAITINPKRAIAYANLGNLYLAENKLKQAVKYYQKALKIDPDYSGLPQELADLV